MGLLDILNNFGKQEPAAPATGDPGRISQVEAVLADVRPMLEMDGGGIALISVDDAGLVIVKLSGACMGCHAQTSTLDGLVEPKLLEALPWVSGVQMV
ncbi:MAG: Fe-S cluster biogenesis protein NfuA [Bacteroidia bacterium]|jgi:Fe-S cluster biogenesis protein NfuA